MFGMALLCKLQLLVISSNRLVAWLTGKLRRKPRRHHGLTLPAGMQLPSLRRQGRRQHGLALVTAKQVITLGQNDTVLVVKVPFHCH